MKYFIIGLLIGMGKIIPGVSGSVIAIRFNVYEKIINSIQGYFKDLKSNTIFLGSVFSGVIVSVLFLSKIILVLYQKYRLIMTFIFAILIISGLKDIIKKDNNYYLSLLSFFVCILVIKLPIKININYFFIGIVESISVIIPGISGTAIFISLGVYEKVLNLFIDLYIPNLIYFGLGFVITSIIIINIMSFLFKRYKKETYSLILGFLIASIILMFI